MRASSVRATAHAIITSDDEPRQHSPFRTTPDEGVRQPPIGSEAVSVPNRASKSPAHPSNRLVAQLNERWRVIDDPLQWILQWKKGNPRNALAQLKSLPDWHPDWDCLNDRANLDVRGTDQVQADARSDRFISQGLEEGEADSHQARVSQSALY
jgi:hypothetical protein